MSNEKKTPVIILNGPKGIGKDTIGQILCERLKAEHLEFKDRLFELALDISGIGEGEWFDRYNTRELKEAPWDKLNGLTQREFLIRISEDWIKPTFGVRYFGDHAHAQVKNAHSTVVFTDGGFNDECWPLIEDKSLVVFCFHLKREGFEFDATDSRTYIDCISRTVELKLTDGEPEEAANFICRYLEAAQDDNALDFNL